MKEADLLARIAIDPRVMAGKPVIRGTRLTVEYILIRIAHGETANRILAEYPGLDAADIEACALLRNN